MMQLANHLSFLDKLNLNQYEPTLYFLLNEVSIQVSQCLIFNPLFQFRFILLFFHIRRIFLHASFFVCPLEISLVF